MVKIKVGSIVVPFGALGNTRCNWGLCDEMRGLIGKRIRVTNIISAVRSEVSAVQARRWTWDVRDLRVPRKKAAK